MNEGEFPDYKDVMTDTSGEKFTVLDVERVSSAAKRVSNFAGSDGTGILMKISGNKITFNARSSDVGTAEEEIEIQNNGVEEIEFLLNFKYLIDAVTNSGTKEVKLFTIADRRPLTFVADKGNYVAVVMPMRKEGV
jgi:DNA polymerase-3 subunit beta